jgi:putrescine transport system substrate-binding protein
MKPSMAKMALGAALALAATAPALAAGKVAIYNWNDYIGPTTLENFTKETGFETSYDLYDSLEVLESKLAVGHTGYDLIVPTAEPTLARLIVSKALRPLDRSKIPNLAHLDPELMKRLESSDPGNQYGVIYQWGTIGLGLIPEKIKALVPAAPLDSWDLILKPELVAKLAPCGVTFLDSEIDVIPTVLNYLGLDPNSEKPEDLARVEELLTKVRPSIRTFVTGQNINNLAGGDTCVVFGYSGDLLQAKARAAEAKAPFTVEYTAPKEGTQLWFDTMAIPADAPNPDGAHAFINFVLKPEVMAGISNTTQYANAVPGSLPLVEAAIRDNPSVFPSAEAKTKMFTIQRVSPAAQRARTRMWTKIKSGQ